MHASQKLAALAAGTIAIAACGGSDNNNNNNGGGGNTSQNPNNRPTFVVGTINTLAYDGNTDDLLTGGLGKDGIGSATAPVPADPAAPTAAELRRYAIWNNYRAIVDTSAAGGYGSLYGPNVDPQGNVTSGQGKIAGVEYLAFADDGTGQQNVTLMAQIPSTFDPNNPCLISATSSGSRGIYGGIAVAEWGLKRGCAVAFTDKGTGAAPHDLDTDTVPLINGTRAARVGAGKTAQFVAQPGAQSLSDFTAAFPHRLAFKHAHSKQNPEKDWGNNTLQAIEFAIWAINDRFGALNTDGSRQASIGKDKIIVIASAVSNGGGAAVAAAEQDTTGLIDGVAVGEPNLNLPPTAGVSVRRGGVTVPASGKHLYDYTTTANLMQLCASQDVNLVNAPFLSSVPGTTAGNRCAALSTAGLITGTDLSSRAAGARAALRAAGWEAESDELYASLSALEVGSSISVTYANAYARASVTDRLCNYSFAAVGGATSTPVQIAPAVLNVFFSTGNGVPPGGGVTLINDAASGGPTRDLVSVSTGSGVADANFPGAKCLRDLLTGTTAQALATQTGIGQTYRTGNLRGKPAVIVHGRSDGLLPVNHTSRPYLGFNRAQEGSASKLSYIEVENAQHFDAFIGAIPGYSNRFIPLHLYVNRALDAVYANLRSNQPLPPSQVVRTTPRGGLNGTVAPAITANNVPAIAASPASGNAIAVSASVVDVPN
ncbi:3-hydroxybutyrate oligomer hydrolase family protein [Cupriavidus plantarum]|uniref:3-hydroxybutyrate oligomer hydrolase family protein n=1 Tax=Cupriavidus plantarum TaxID=942865 RepID=UPI000E24F440|nr:3-hydroxybutyrate oligomer hydrolase family protein [Cupriavidus plantarum]NYH98710.1 hydroxybutyrate-dimer hydrolase [Cupriavidus plantarum]REF01634.1 hydroxybutyrate-dimer hydrolase [Cupriavidus plantarum]